MNFKLTWLKVILVIVIGLFIGLIYQSLFHALDYSALGMSAWFKWERLIQYSIISVLVVYLIWSLIQNKK